MKSTGVVRRIDDLGRIVVPKEIRKNLRIREGESLEIYVNNEQIILKKHSHISDISTAMEILLQILEKKYDIDYLVIEDNKVKLTSKNYKSHRGKSFNKIDIENGISKDIKMHGDVVSKIIFYTKRDSKEIIDITSDFLSKYMEQ